MSPFIWFAIILTVAYLIYYTVIVMNDLYGKHGEVKSNIEEFESPEGHEKDGDFDVPDETPIAITETKNGFAIAGEEEEVPVVVSPLSTVEDEFASTMKEKEVSKPSPAESINESLADKVEEIEPAFSDDYYKDELHATMLNNGTGRIGRPNIPVKPFHDEL